MLNYHSPEPLSLLTRGHPQLARRSDFVEAISAPDFQAFLDDLIQSGEENMGVGIAAPQVGKNLRAFILSPKPSTRYPDSPLMEPTPIVNPEILEFLGPVELGWEGCLSVPGFRGQVPRYWGVRACFTDRNGTQQERLFEGFIARIFQHEFDHLEGILYPDRMGKAERLLDLDEYFAETGIRLSK